MDGELRVDGIRLAAHLARPTLTRSGGTPGVVLCHGFPAGPPKAGAAPSVYPQLADRIAAESGFVVLTMNFRGTGASGGDFSLGGWINDVRAAVDQLTAEAGVRGIWVAGSSMGGSVALCEAATDARVEGVATLGAPSDFESWAADPRAFLEHCRRIGVIRAQNFPSDVQSWNRELRTVRPLDCIAATPPNAVLVMHGSDDEAVPVADARALAEAAGDKADLRIIAGAAHRLHHDPRAVAVLLGWLIRQAG